MSCGEEQEQAPITDPDRQQDVGEKCGGEEERRDAKEHSQYPPNEFLYVNVVPSSFVTVLPSPPVVITLWGFPEPLPLPLELELPDEPELPEPDEDAALPEVESGGAATPARRRRPSPRS